MAYTQSDIDALEDALASGELSVTFRDRTITYRSIAEIREALSVVKPDVSSQISGEDETAVLFMTSRTGHR